MKTRKNVRDNFSYSLLLCVEEAKERDQDILKILGVMDQPESSMLDMETYFEFCRKIGLAIESAMFHKYELQIVIYHHKSNLSLEQRVQQQVPPVVVIIEKR